MKYTGNYGLRKPDGTDIVNIEDLNANMDILDSEVAKKVDKVAGKQLSTENYTSAEKTKLAGIEAGANKYTHPSTHPASMITESTSRRFVSDTEKSTWNAKETPTGAQAKVNAHASRTDNPHAVTKTQVGLGSVDNVKQVPITGGTMTGILTAQSNTSYTTRQVRNIIISADAANASLMQNGDIWIQYK